MSLSAQEKVDALRTDIRAHLNDNRRGEILRAGIRVAIFGPPNAGKSSLLNFLGKAEFKGRYAICLTHPIASVAQREAAIVTPLPGTTRDVLELSLDIGGMPVIVADTAGLRKTSDVVEAIGVDRAQQTLVQLLLYASAPSRANVRFSAAAADLTICVLSLPDVLNSPVQQDIRNLIKPNTVILLNKSDLVMEKPAKLPGGLVSHEPQLCWQASVARGTGMPEFIEGLTKVLHQQSVPFCRPESFINDELWYLQLQRERRRP